MNVLNIRTVVFFIVTSIICVAAYYPGLSGPLIFDDVHTILNNDRIKIDSLTYDQLSDAAQSFVAGGRELSMLTFALDYYFFGDSIFALKATTLALHLLVGMLFYVLAMSLVDILVSPEKRRTNVLMRYLPEIVTFLWLVNPINLTSVLYVSQRMTVLSTLFMLLGVLIYFLIRKRRAHRLIPVVMGSTGIVLCLIAAYLSKEIGLLLVPLLVVVELVVFQFKDSHGNTHWKLVGAIAGLMLLAIILVVAAGVVDFSRLLDAYEFRAFTLEERVLTQFRVLMLYIGLILFPLASRFGLWHDDFPLSESLLVPPDTLPTIFLLVLLFFLAFVVLRRYPLVSFGILWFFVGHSLESTIFPLEIIHEHRNYMPSFGVILTLVSFLGYLERVRQKLKIALLAALGLASVYNLYSRASHWSGFYRHALYEYMNHPASARANFRLANATFKLAVEGVEGARESAYKLYQNAGELDPSSILPEVGLLLATSQLDDTYDPRLIEIATEKLRTHGNIIANAPAFKSIRKCSTEGDCSFKVKDLRPLFEMAAELNEYRTLTEAAIFYTSALKQPERSLELLNRAVELAPNRIVPRLNYIEALIANGRIDEARKSFESIESDRVFNVRLEREWIKRIKDKLDGVNQDDSDEGPSESDIGSKNNVDTFNRAENVAPSSEN